MDGPERYKSQDPEVYISKFLRLCLPSQAVGPHTFSPSTRAAEAQRTTNTYSKTRWF